KALVRSKTSIEERNPTDAIGLTVRTLKSADKIIEKSFFTLVVTAGWILPVVRGGRAIMGASVIVDSVMPRGGDTFVDTAGGDMFAGTRGGDKFVGTSGTGNFN
ncbi:unnamed protein product, partial [Didymodactylos carnosus]